MYAQRILNVRVSLSKYIKKDATALISLRNNAWKTVNSFNAGVNANTAVATTIVDPNAGKAMCGAVLNTEANITDVITRVTASLKFTPTISCPENIYETSLKDSSCKTTSKDESEDDCKEKKAKTVTFAVL